MVCVAREFRAVADIGNYDTYTPGMALITLLIFELAFFLIGLEYARLDKAPIDISRSRNFFPAPVVLRATKGKRDRQSTSATRVQAPATSSRNA